MTFKKLIALSALFIFCRPINADISPLARYALKQEVLSFGSLTLHKDSLLRKEAAQNKDPRIAEFLTQQKKKRNDDLAQVLRKIAENKKALIEHNSHYPYTTKEEGENIKKPILSPVHLIYDQKKEELIVKNIFGNPLLTVYNVTPGKSSHRACMRLFPQRNSILSSKTGWYSYDSKAKIVFIAGFYRYPGEPSEHDGAHTLVITAKLMDKSGEKWSYELCEELPQNVHMIGREIDRTLWQNENRKCMMKTNECACSKCKRETISCECSSGRTLALFFCNQR